MSVVACLSLGECLVYGVSHMALVDEAVSEFIDEILVGSASRVTALEMS